MGVWCRGNIFGSNPKVVGSIPTAPAYDLGPQGPVLVVK